MGEMPPCSLWQAQELAQGAVVAMLALVSLTTASNVSFFGRLDW